MELVEGAEALGIDMDDLKIEKGANNMTDQGSKSAPNTKPEKQERNNVECKTSTECKEDPTWLPQNEVRDTKFTCNYCKKRFSKSTTLDRHLISHVKIGDSDELKFASEALFSCNMCNKTFKDENTLNVHLRSHKSLNFQQCDRCEKSFLRSEDLKQHIVDVHTPYEELPIVCDICEWRFKRPEYLKAHMTREHEKGEVPTD